MEWRPGHRRRPCWRCGDHHQSGDAARGGRWRSRVAPGRAHPVTEHALAAERLHFAWDNSLSPVLEVDPGDTVTCATWDASGHDVQRSWTSADAAKRQPKP